MGRTDVKRRCTAGMLSVGVSSSARRNPALDGVRGLAIILVMAYHFQTGRWVPGGRVGVDVFFVLSGFLITTLLVEERERRGAIGLAGFYPRRARRLLPAATMLLVIWVPLALVFGRNGWFFTPLRVSQHVQLLASDVWRTLMSVLTLDLNIQLASGHRVGLGHLWSLMVEEQFYLIWPVLLALLLRLGRRCAGLLALVLALAFASWVVVLPMIGPTTFARLYYSTDTRAQGLLIGAALALLLPEYLPRLSRRTSSTLGSLAALSLGLVCVRADDRVILGVLTVAAVASASLITYAMCNPFGRILTFGPLRWLGRRSYALYLWHFVFATWVDRLGLWGVPIGVLASLLTSEISWRVIEQRWLRPADRTASVVFPAEAEQRPPALQVISLDRA